ncbi:MAG TPA: peptidoglycan recognition family protein [Thermoanaerobaculia bacterium]|nr:peptidoglycan recognition family protein [Thermoanaerobaculia bacterium]
MSRWIKVEDQGLSLMEGEQVIAVLAARKVHQGLRLEIEGLEGWTQGSTPGNGTGLEAASFAAAAAFPEAHEALAELEQTEIHPGVGSGLPPKPPVTWIESPNFNSRNGQDIDTLILHNTDGSLQSAIQRFLNPAAQVSAHYIVDRDGQIVQMVRDENNAWHAGNKPVNLRSIGIEIVAWKDARGMTSPQEQKVVQLCRYVLGSYDVSLANVRPHRAVRIGGTDCPGWIWPTDADLERWKTANLAAI